MIIKVMHKEGTLALRIRRRAGMLLAGAGLLSLAAALPAAADEADPVTISGVLVVGQRQQGYEVETTATATKTDTPLRDVPQAVTVITDDVIRDLSMRSMADVVRYVPGVAMGQGEGHRDAPTIRGQSTTADFFIDGVRDDVQYFRDLYNVERVEVLKGPNAMIFGRGGGGGVINRVTRQADWSEVREALVEGGAYGYARATIDLGQPFTAALAGRLTAMYENSDSFRDFVHVERWGVNPTLSWKPNDRLWVGLAYEHFDDDRTVDRGLPSFNGRPAPAERDSFFGDPDQSYATTTVDFLRGTMLYSAPNGVSVRNHTHFAGYAKFYQNVYAGGAAFADPATGELRAPIAAYNNDTQRRNLFNQTDITFRLTTGAVKHTLLVGAELGRQDTENFRQTGFFATPLTVPLSSPTVFGAPVVFAQAPTDGDNRTDATVAAVYVQDQLEITPWLQLVGGLRFNAFDVDFHDNRTGADRGRRDDLLSPRLGVVMKPREPLSFYASYSVSYLPSSGDQFATLDATTETLEPEEFVNYEVGAKWDLRPGLSLTAALYQLERTNTRFTAPSGVTLQTGASRSRGFELALAGRLTEAWEVIGGSAWQDAETTAATGTSPTSIVPAGRVLPLTPRHSFSLWNKYQFTPRWAAGLGVIHQEEMFASTSNTVELPSFTRIDAALYWAVTPNLEAQVNLENLFDETYFPTSHGDNNILPGSPRAVRVSLTSRF